MGHLEIEWNEGYVLGGNGVELYLQAKRFNISQVGQGCEVSS